MNRVEDALEARYKKCLADLLRFCADEEEDGAPTSLPLQFPELAIWRARRAMQRSGAHPSVVEDLLTYAVCPRIPMANNEELELIRDGIAIVVELRRGFFL